MTPDGKIVKVNQAFKGENIILPEFEYEAEKTSIRIGVNTIANKAWIQPRLYPVKKEKGEGFCNSLPGKERTINTFSSLIWNNAFYL